MKLSFWDEHRQIKQADKDAILIYRIGDFFEAYLADAEKIAPVIGTTIASRQGFPMTGFPCHSRSGFIAALVDSGYRVVVREPIPGSEKYETTMTIKPGCRIPTAKNSPKGVLNKKRVLPAWLKVIEGGKTA